MIQTLFAIAFISALVSFAGAYYLRTRSRTRLERGFGTFGMLLMVSVIFNTAPAALGFQAPLVVSVIAIAVGGAAAWELIRTLSSSGAEWKSIRTSFRARRVP